MKNEKEKETVRELILKEAPQMRLPCPKAFEIAGKTGCSPAEVGKLCDELSVKIFGCQLGCF